MRTFSGVRWHVTYAPLVTLVVVLLPALAAAQEPVKSFDQLNTRLKVGDTVWVTDAQGREIKGKIIELHDASVTLDHEGQTMLRAENVRVVERRVKSIKMAALIGLVVGAVGGVAIGVSAKDSGTAEQTQAAALGLGVGAGIGAAAGAGIRLALPAGRKDVYRAPGASSSTRLSISPVITARTKSVALSYSF